MEQTSQLSAVILVGGQSCRMGYPKYLAKIGTQTFLERQLNVLSPIFNEIILVAGQGQCFQAQPQWPQGIKVVTDLVGNRGPIGGLYTGLHTAAGSGVFLTACDMPFLDQRAIRELIDGFDCEKLEGRIPVSLRGLEPLHGVYSKRILKPLEASIYSGELSLRRLIANSKCEVIDWSCRRTNSLININTPEELELVKNLLID